MNWLFVAVASVAFAFALALVCFLWVVDPESLKKRRQ